MRNPYAKSSLKRLKRKSPGRYALVWLVTLPLYLPLYLLWLLSSLMERTFNGPLSFKVGRFFRSCWQPFWAPVEVFRAWCLTREWKKLLFASPLLVFALVLLSVLYINKNSRRQDVHKNQLRRASIALQEGEHAEAGVIFGRLIRLPQYQDDPMVLFQTMVVAAQTGNLSRYQTLEKRLVEEFNFAPARRWLAQRILATPGVQSKEIQEAIDHLDVVLAQAVTDEEKDEVIRLLAQLYMNQGRFDMARRQYESLSSMEPDSSLQLARVYLSLDNQYKAELIARELLEKLKLDDPEGIEFLSERVSAYLVLVTSSSVTTEQMELLQRASDLLARGSKYLEDDRQNRARVASAYFQLSRLYLSMGDEQAVVLGMVCLSKSLETGMAPSGAGWMLLHSCDPAGSYPVSEQAIQKMLVQGEGAVVCHLRLGLDAWRMNKDRLAIFHFNMAQHHDPAAFDLLRSVARYLASANEESIVGSVRFVLQNKAPWVTAIELLKVVGEAEGEESEKTLLARCDILAARERWADIPILLEPELESLSPELKPKAFSYLITAHTRMHDYTKAKHYRELYKNYMEELWAVSDE